MRCLLQALAGATLLLLTSGEARAQQACSSPDVCVPQEDFHDFVELLKQQSCRSHTAPVFRLDPITIVADKDGRVYSTGNDPRPYTVTVDWCNYKLDAAGKVPLIVAQELPETGGLRFRAKATLGVLGAELWKDPKNSVDAGVLLEPLFYHDFNVNLYLGAHAFGAGLGLDLTRVVGLYGGFAMTWGTWAPNPHLGLSVALW